jgi:imidazolonepropionase-like amidohydrolase
MGIDLDEPANIISVRHPIKARLLNRDRELGIIAPGSYADLLVVEGDPLKDLRVMTNPQKNRKPIMKDGVIYKSEL